MIFSVFFEEIECSIASETILVNFEANFIYRASGCSPRRVGRIADVEIYDREITVLNIETDEEIKISLLAKDDLRLQVEAAIWRDEDRIYSAAHEDLLGEFHDAQERRWEAARDGCACGWN